MFITTAHEIISLMPTARWEEPRKLLGYLEEEERLALEPLLGTPLYNHLCEEYTRLTGKYVDITAATVRPTHKAKADPAVPYADVTELQDAIQSGQRPYVAPCVPSHEEDDVPDEDLQTIRLLRICQQIEFYKMLSHKAGLLSVSFNEGGGANRVSADGYEPADSKELDRMAKDAFMSAGRSVDSLLLFLEADAKGGRLFTDLWQQADAFYLHKDLLFQTARALNEFLDIKGERMAYVQLVRDIRFCQMTYLKPRIGAKLLKAAVDYANGSDGSTGIGGDAVYDELVEMLRTALAFYVESRRTTLTHINPFSGSGSRNSSSLKEDALARRDSMTDAQQAMAMACQFVEDNLDALGDAAVDTPIYNAVRERDRQAEQDAADADAARRRICRQRMDQSRRKLFTAFPHTHRNPEYK